MKTIYTKPLRMPDEAPSRINNSIEVTIEDDKVVKVEQLTPVKKEFEVDTALTCGLELVETDSTGYRLINLYKITDENMLNLLANGTKIGGWVSVFTTSNYSVKGLSEIIYNYLENFLNVLPPELQEEFKKFLEIVKVCLVDGCSMPMTDLSEDLDHLLASLLQSYLESKDYIIITPPYAILRCLDYAKYFKLCLDNGYCDDDSQYKYVVDLISILFSGIGIIYMNPEDLSPYIAILNALIIDEPIQYTISYYSEYGTAPNNKTVGEEYCLDENDLPDMSYYCPAEYTFEGWSTDGGYSFAVPGDLVTEDLYLTAIYSYNEAPDDPTIYE